jgi:hypothetical protein
MACTEDPDRSLSAKIAWEINAIVAIFAVRCIEGLVVSVFGKTFGLLSFLGRSRRGFVASYKLVLLLRCC